MSFTTQCWTCGEDVTIVAARINAGLHDCPSCHDLGVKVPECEEFPPLEPLDLVEEFDAVCPW